MSIEYRICTRCVMDSSDPDIEFDEGGRCNHCRQVDALRRIPPQSWTAAERQRALGELVAAIRHRGVGRRYDCILGVSGGVDSSYTALKAHQLGLRILAVHLDNGWDSEPAVHNIERLLKKLDIDLFTYIIDWEEFRDLQVAFLRASTPDSEIPTDHAINAVLNRVAAKNGVGTIMMGNNLVTESIHPPAWSHGHWDWKYIRSIHGRFGSVRLKTFPDLRLTRWANYRLLRRIQQVNLLDYIVFRRSEAVAELQAELGWQDYGGKHHESTYTRFFQSYILPNKFGIDKRRMHLSNLILAGETTRELALAELQRPAIAPEEARLTLDFVLKKLRLSAAEFDRIMASPRRTFWDYPSYETTGWFRFLQRVNSLIRHRR